MAIRCAILGADFRGPGPNSVIIAALNLMLTKTLSAGMSCFSATA